MKPLEPKLSITPTSELGPKILSFEEFSNRPGNYPPHYNNFFLRFGGGFGGKVYRTKKDYKQFESEYPDMAKSLCERIQKLSPWNMSEQLKPFEKDLYEVYKILRGWGFSDEELFS